jgi:hypothetical protein
MVRPADAVTGGTHPANVRNCRDPRGPSRAVAGRAERALVACRTPAGEPVLDRLDERVQGEFIDAGRSGATAASLAGAHRAELSLTSSAGIAARSRCTSWSDKDEFRPERRSCTEGVCRSSGTLGNGL